jgi:His/Glu/Gln/Arg/opine family amino acid ABC transporter permease subunit
VTLFARWAEYFSQGMGDGLAVTLQTMAVAAVATLGWGLLVAVLRMSPFAPFKLLAQAYIELFRGTPLIVQILILFAAVPQMTRVYLPPFTTAVLALTLKEGSFVAETYRSGLQAVPRGQVEAATALGMSSFVRFRRVIFPQAIRVVLPALVNSLTALLLLTPFVFLAGLQDMMARANQILNRTGDFSVYLLATLVYVLVALALVGAHHFIERRLRVPGTR